MKNFCFDFFIYSLTLQKKIAALLHNNKHFELFTLRFEELIGFDLDFGFDLKGKIPTLTSGLLKKALEFCLRLEGYLAFIIHTKESMLTSIEAEIKKNNEYESEIFSRKTFGFLERLEEKEDLINFGEHLELDFLLEYNFEVSDQHYLPNFTSNTSVDFGTVKQEKKITFHFQEATNLNLLKIRTKKKVFEKFFICYKVKGAQEYVFLPDPIELKELNFLNLQIDACIEVQIFCDSAIAIDQVCDPEFFGGNQKNIEQKIIGCFLLESKTKTSKIFFDAPEDLSIFSLPLQDFSEVQNTLLNVKNFNQLQNVKIIPKNTLLVFEPEDFDRVFIFIGLTAKTTLPKIKIFSQG